MISKGSSAFRSLRILTSLAVLFVTVGIGALFGIIELPSAIAQYIPYPAKSSAPYDKVDKSAGVWNDGQAALWDLPFIDHFMIFGATERARGYSPAQPIKFSHVRHVQGNQMECQYCHWTVTKSNFAAIPEVSTCMGCHMLVGGTTQEQKDQIALIREASSKGQPIEWNKVHVMPDHVRFNHKRHVKAGVACHECHGQVPAMPVVERVSSMKMGWCIDCHRAKGTSIDCTTCHK